MTSPCGMRWRSRGSRLTKRLSVCGLGLVMLLTASCTASLILRPVTIPPCPPEPKPDPTLQMFRRDDGTGHVTNYQAMVEFLLALRVAGAKCRTVVDEARRDQ